MTSQAERTTKVQRDTILRVLGEHDADQFLVEYDEDHDTFFFLTLYRGGRQIYETVIEADGQEADD